MKRMLRYDSKGKKSHQLSIPVGSDLLLHDTGFGYQVYNLAFEVAEWLKTNCSEDYRVIPSRWNCDIHFQSERDATLFWTFHA